MVPEDLDLASRQLDHARGLISDIQMLRDILDTGTAAEIVIQFPINQDGRTPPWFRTFDLQSDNSALIDDLSSSVMECLTRHVCKMELEFQSL